MAEERYWLGIDPGCSSGAIALLWPSGELHGTWKMPADPAGLVDLLRDLPILTGQAAAMLERVHAGGTGTGNREGQRKMGASSAFKFGVNFGAIQASLVALQIPFELITPGKWKPLYSLRRAKDEIATETKAREHAAALRLFPGGKFPKYAAASVLLAELSRRRWSLELQTAAE